MISSPSLPFEFNQDQRSDRNPILKRMFESVDQPILPPDLLNDSDDEDTSSTPSSFISSPKSSSYHSIERPKRKSIPYKSPSIIKSQDETAAEFDKSVVFQLDLPLTQDDPFICTSKIIYGQSLLSSLRHQVIHARYIPQKPIVLHRKRARTISMIEIPRSNYRTTETSQPIHAPPEDAVIVVPEPQRWVDPSDEPKTPPVSERRLSTQGSTGRLSRTKGPCQACQETSDGCMRKAFNWPFPSTQVFSDKGKPFVYLCNKCGLRYNKSGGSVCRHCRWVFCKEEKRKALQHIAMMNRPFIDPNEDIENFVCSPKYWACGKPWKVGWVLDNVEDNTKSI